MIPLYQPLLERELDAIPEAVRAFRAEHSSHELFLAIARFAILAYAPSQHAKHAVLACLSAYQLRDQFGDRYDDALIECARYAASSRLPWSEPPLFEPPEPSSGSIDELRAAVRDGDRLAAEKWLAARLTNCEQDLYEVATDDFEDLGHKLIMANAAVKLANILGEKGRYAALRIAVWEMTAYRADPPGERAAPNLDDLIARCDGSLESTHRVFLYCAARDTNLLHRLPANLADAPRAQPLAPRPSPLAPYRFAKDCGATLKAHALQLNNDHFLAAVHHNLAHGESLEDFSFA